MLGVLLVTTLPIIILLPGALFQSGPLAFSVFFSFCGEISLLDNKNMCVKKSPKDFYSFWKNLHKVPILQGKMFLNRHI